MVSVSGSAIARRLASPMLSRIATQKDAEHASQTALESVVCLKIHKYRPMTLQLWLWPVNVELVYLNR
jgi:hypothetical protein